MLFQRVITAVLGVILVLSALWVGGVFLGMLFAAIAVVSTLEIGTMMKIAKTSAESVVAIAFAILIVLWPGFERFWFALFYALLVLTIVRRESFSFSGAGVLFAGALYSSYAFRTLLDLRETSHGLAFVLIILIAIWSTDTGAFFVGRALGGRKLMPEVSPKKTVSGALGGLVLAIVLTVATGVLMLPHALKDWGMLALLGALISIAGQTGDLVESALKRHYAVKDSGWLLPGHGGLLDRFDSLLLAAPIAYHFIIWFFPAYIS